jgi:hypothetical protein
MAHRIDSKVNITINKRGVFISWVRARAEYCSTQAITRQLISARSVTEILALGRGLCFQYLTGTVPHMGRLVPARHPESGSWKGCQGEKGNKCVEKHRGRGGAWGPPFAVFSFAIPAASALAIPIHCLYHGLDIGGAVQWRRLDETCPALCLVHQLSASLPSAAKRYHAGAGPPQKGRGVLFCSAANLNS